MAKLLLFSLVRLFSFVSAFPHFSDKIYFLAKVFPQTKGRLRTPGASVIGSCSISVSAEIALFTTTWIHRPYQVMGTLNLAQLLPSRNSELGLGAGDADK